MSVVLALYYRLSNNPGCGGGVLNRVAYGFVNITNFAARALLLAPGMAA